MAIYILESMDILRGRMLELQDMQEEEKDDTLFRAHDTLTRLKSLVAEYSNQGRKWSEAVNKVEDQVAVKEVDTEVTWWDKKGELYMDPRPPVKDQPQ